MATFRKRGNKWEYRIREKDLVGDEPISEGGFNTKSEARAVATKIENDLRNGMNRNQGEMLFSEYYDRWMITYKIGVFSEVTDEEYLFVSRLIKDNFKNVKLKDITKLAYQEFLNDYSEGKAKTTVQKTHKKIAPCLREAFANRHIPVDVTHNVVFRGNESQKESEKYINLHEAEKLTEALLDGLDNSTVTRYMAILQLATGMRVGEIMALQFKDIDFLHNQISINKKWDYKFTNDFAPTKNKETRTIAVDENTLKILRPFYDFQLNQKVQDHKQRLFATRRTVPTVDAVNGMLQRACKRADIQRVTSHALRHTHASMLILEGAPVPYISERLGHKSITITLETYSHVLDELKAKGDEEVLRIISNLY